MSFEKTAVLIASLNVDNIGGDLKVRLNNAQPDPTSLLFLSNDKEMLLSLVKGFRQALHLPHSYKIGAGMIFESTNTPQSKFHLAISINDISAVCRELKLDFKEIVAELKRNNAYISNEPAINPLDTTATPKKSR